MNDAVWNVWRNWTFKRAEIRAGEREREGERERGRGRERHSNVLDVCDFHNVRGVKGFNYASANVLRRYF